MTIEEIDLIVAKTVNRLFWGAWLLWFSLDLSGRDIWGDKHKWLVAGVLLVILVLAEVGESRAQKRYNRAKGITRPTGLDPSDWHRMDLRKGRGQ